MFLMDWVRRLFNNKNNSQKNENWADLISITTIGDSPEIVIELATEPLPERITLQMLVKVWPQALDHITDLPEALKQELKKRSYALSLTDDNTSLYISDEDTSLIQQLRRYQDTIARALSHALGIAIRFQITDTLTITFDADTFDAEDDVSLPPPTNTFIDIEALKFIEQSDVFSRYKPEDGNIYTIPTSASEVEFHWFRTRRKVPTGIKSEYVDAFCISSTEANSPWRTELLFQENVHPLSLERPLSAEQINDVTRQILAHLSQQRRPISNDTFFLFVANFPPNGIHHLTRPFDFASPRVTAIPFAISTMLSTQSGLPAKRLFLENLKKWINRTNRYALTNPVMGDDYYRHDATTENIQQAIAQGQPFGLFGLRRMGKTSLLHEMLRTQAFGPACVSFKDMQAYPSRPIWAVLRDAIIDWKHALAPRLSEEQCAELAQIDPDRAFAPLDSSLFWEYIQTLLRLLPEEERLVLLLDEVGELLPKSPKYLQAQFPDWHEFLAFLRAIYYESRGSSGAVHRFVLGVATYKNDIVHNTFGDAGQNPWLQQFREILLGPLSRADCDHMVQDIGAMVGLYFAPDALQVLYEQTNGHPFTTRELCNLLIERTQELPHEVQSDQVRTVASWYSQKSQTLQSTFEALEQDEQVIVQHLAEHGESRIADMQRILVPHLTAQVDFERNLWRMGQFGLIRNDDAAGTVDLSLKLFSNFMNTRAKEKNV